MKAVRFSAFGAPHEVAECVEVDDVGPPGDGEVVIDVEAFPINPADLLTLEGRYSERPALPATPGAEAVGRIVAVGGAVRGVAVGDRVINLGRENWVQRLRVAADRVIGVPRDGDALQLAMLKINPATALLMLRDYVGLAPGDWVIQNAANSGVGTLAIRLAAARGVRTVNAVRRAELGPALAALGADAVVVDGDDLAARVARATDGARPVLGLDAVAGEATARLAECVADGGTVVTYGRLSGAPSVVPTEATIYRGVTFTGFWLVRALRGMARAEVEALYADLAARVARGELGVAIEASYPIEDIRQALAHAAREGRGGKVLVTPNGPVGAA